MQQQAILFTPSPSFEETSIRSGAPAQNERRTGLGTRTDHQETVLGLQLLGHFKKEVVCEAVHMDDLEFGDDHILVEDFSLGQQFAAPADRLIGSDIGDGNLAWTALFLTTVRVPQNLPLMDLV